MMTAPQPDRDRLTLFETAIVLACLLYGLAVAVGVVWLLMRIVRLIWATGHGDAICGVAIVVLLMVAVVVAAPRR
jgi:hypothetical protein